MKRIVQKGSVLSIVVAAVGVLVAASFVGWGNMAIALIVILIVRELL